MKLLLWVEVGFLIVGMVFSYVIEVIRKLYVKFLLTGLVSGIYA